MCTYQQDYVKLPLHGVIVNRELYKIHKQAFAGSGGNVSGVSSLNSMTTFRDSYQKHTATEREKAKPGICRPEGELHVDLEAPLLFTNSLAHEHYPAPDTSIGLGRQMTYSSGVSRPPVKLPFKSSSTYRRDYYNSDLEYVKESNMPLNVNNVVKPVHAKLIAEAFLSECVKYA